MTSDCVTMANGVNGRANDQTAYQQKKKNCQQNEAKATNTSICSFHLITSRRHIELMNGWCTAQKKQKTPTKWVFCIVCYYLKWKSLFSPHPNLQCYIIFTEDIFFVWQWFFIRVHCTTSTTTTTNNKHIAIRRKSSSNNSIMEKCIYSLLAHNLDTQQIDSIHRNNEKKKKYRRKHKTRLKREYRLPTSPPLKTIQKAIDINDLKRRRSKQKSAFENYLFSIVHGSCVCVIHLQAALCEANEWSKTKKKIWIQRGDCSSQ